MLWIVDEVTRGDITCALDRVNAFFADNIRMDDLMDCGLDDEMRGLWKFSLHVVSMSGPGRKFTRPPSEYYVPQLTESICWDVRFLFFYELPDRALIKVGNHWLPRVDCFYPVQFFNHGVTTYSILECCECEGAVRHQIARKGRGSRVTYNAYTAR